MLKLMGAAMIIAAGTAWGFGEAYKLKKRSEELEKIVSALELLENDIAYGKRDIKSALYGIGEICGVEIFKKTAESIEKSGIKEALLQALHENGEYLLGTDKEALEILSENLGMTDIATQIKSLRHAGGVLKQAKCSADGEYAKSGKLKRSIGVLGGIFAVILLF